MSRRMSIASGILVVLAVLFAVLLAASVPALAHHKDGHEQGQQSEETEEESEEASSEDSEQESTEDEGSTAQQASQDDHAPKGDNANGGGKSKKSSTSDSGSSSSETSTTSSSQSSSSTSSTQGASDSTSDQQNCDPTHGSDTGHGANTDGPNNQYHNTCEPEHRPGNGQGTAKPCAGCVGNADDKNPPGQFPNGTDANNGYECDGNQGVGKENPAHTGCKPPVTCPPNTPGCVPPPPPPPPPGCPPNSNAPQCNPSVVEVCDGDMTQPGIQSCRNPVKPCDADRFMPGIQPCLPDVVLGRRDFVPPAPEPRPPTPPQVAPRPPLPFTGAGSTAGLMILGLAMMVLGGALTKASRQA